MLIFQFQSTNLSSLVDTIKQLWKEGDASKTKYKYRLTNVKRVVYL